MEKRLNLSRDGQIKCEKHVIVLHYGQNIATLRHAGCVHDHWNKISVWVDA